MEIRRFRAHWIRRPRVIASGVLTVFFLDRLIALVDERGKIVWRDPAFPLYFVEYLIENPPPQYRWN